MLTICRFYSRHYLVRKVNASDWVMLLALVRFIDTTSSEMFNSFFQDSSLGFSSSQLVCNPLPGLLSSTCESFHTFTVPHANHHPEQRNLQTSRNRLSPLHLDLPPQLHPRPVPDQNLHSPILQLHRLLAQKLSPTRPRSPCHQPHRQCVHDHRFDIHMLSYQRCVVVSGF